MSHPGKNSHFGVRCFYGAVLLVIYSLVRHQRIPSVTTLRVRWYEYDTNGDIYGPASNITAHFVTCYKHSKKAKQTNKTSQRGCRFVRSERREGAQSFYTIRNQRRQRTIQIIPNLIMINSRRQSRQLGSLSISRGRLS